jgi:hypothetical protein
MQFFPHFSKILSTFWRKLKLKYTFFERLWIINEKAKKNQFMSEYLMQNYHKKYTFK